MTKTRLSLTFIYLFFLCLIFASGILAATEKKETFKKYLKIANVYIRSHRHFEAADALKEATRLGGAKHPSLHMRLGILYYGLGLIPEAIVEGKKAVKLAPSSKWYKYDLAKFYLVDRQYKKAHKQLFNLLSIDPGFTFGYYYLAELYFQEKAYDMAWLSYQRAKLLGHRGKHLETKLAPFTSKPAEDIKNSPDKTLFRFIKVSSKDKAQKILDKINSGKLFENLELELKKEKAEGFSFGTIMLSELKNSIAQSLKGSQPYAIPVVIKTSPDYRVMQRILPFNKQTWQETFNNTVTTLNKAEKIPRGYEEHFSAKLAAFYALENWKDIWETANIEEFLASYSKKFLPENDISFENWKKTTRNNLSLPSFIHIDIDDPVVEMLTDTQMLVTFQQSYESNISHSIVIKTLTMNKEETGWKIIREQVIAGITD